jgi:hypothetical protein
LCWRTQVAGGTGNLSHPALPGRQAGACPTRTPLRGVNGYQNRAIDVGFKRKVVHVLRAIEYTQRNFALELLILSLVVYAIHTLWTTLLFARMRINKTTQATSCAHRSAVVSIFSLPVAAFDSLLFLSAMEHWVLGSDNLEKILISIYYQRSHILLFVKIVSTCALLYGVFAMHAILFPRRHIDKKVTTDPFTPFLVFSEYAYHLMFF